MATKNISITEDAYRRLASLRKRENESFTEIICRITGKKNLIEFCGIWSKEEADAFEKNLKKIRKTREKQDKERRERMKKGFS